LPHILVRHHGPVDPHKNTYPLKAQNTVFLFIISHKYSSFNHTETLYLPGYAATGAALMIIKETHCT